MKIQGGNKHRGQMVKTVLETVLTETVKEPKKEPKRKATVIPFFSDKPREEIIEEVFNQQRPEEKSEDSQNTSSNKYNDPYFTKLSVETEKEKALKKTKLKDKSEQLKNLTKLNPLENLYGKLKYPAHRNSAEETKIQKEVIEEIAEMSGLQFNAIDIKFIFDSQFRLIPEAIKNHMGVHVPYFGRFWFNKKYEIFKEWKELHPEVDELPTHLKNAEFVKAFYKSDLYKESNWKQKKRFREQGLYSLTEAEQIRYFREVVTKQDLNAYNGVLVGKERTTMKPIKISKPKTEETKE